MKLTHASFTFKGNGKKFNVDYYPEKDDKTTYKVVVAVNGIARKEGTVSGRQALSHSNAKQLAKRFTDED